MGSIKNFVRYEVMSAYTTNAQAMCGDMHLIGSWQGFPVGTIVKIMCVSVNCEGDKFPHVSITHREISLHAHMAMTYLLELGA